MRLFSSMVPRLARLFSRDNLIALVLCLLLIALLVVSANTAPTFLYQQF